MIADHVWDYQFDSDYNLIEVYIRRLRQKIEKPLGKQLIRPSATAAIFLKYDQ